MALNLKQYDTRTAIKATLKNSKGEPVDLSSATVKFKMVKYSNNLVIVNREADKLSEIGKVVFVFTTEDTNELGAMKAEFEVTYSDGSIETFPNSGYIMINIEAKV